MNKKVIISVPSKEDGRAKGGILDKVDVIKIEELLKKDPKIDFQGNVDLAKVKVCNNNFSCDGLALEDADLFFWYTSNRFIKNFLDILKALSNLTKVTKDPNSFGIIQDKFMAHSLLKKAGLPVPEFALVKFDDQRTMKKIASEWKELLIKPRLGDFGNGIIKIDSFELLRDVAGILKTEHNQKQVFVEKFYPNDMNKWISATIFSNEIAYGYRKISDKIADWKVFDIKRRSGGAFYVDPKPIEKTAKKAASLFGNCIIGFDFIKTPQGYKIVDENNSPGIYLEAFKQAEKDVSSLVFKVIKDNLLPCKK